jgi:hypothetical protein
MGNRIMRRIADLAYGIEPDRQAVWDWLLLTPIKERGDRTAVEIALAGEGEHVVSLLESVAAGNRNL